LNPLLSALSRLLKPSGRFDFAITHPCFNSGSQLLTMEQEDREGEIVTTYAIKIVKYLSLGPHKGLAIIGQPVPQYCFDRPLHVLLNACFRAGFVLDGLEEPAFGPEVQGNQPLSWANFKDIPMVVAARLRLLG
jgi:hypothetical protein